jgi:hypothetical protein
MWIVFRLIFIILKYCLKSVEIIVPQVEISHKTMSIIAVILLIIGLTNIFSNESMSNYLIFVSLYILMNTYYQCFNMQLNICLMILVDLFDIF